MHDGQLASEEIKGKESMSLNLLSSFRMRASSDGQSRDGIKKTAIVTGDESLDRFGLRNLGLFSSVCNLCTRTEILVRKTCQGFHS
jgi:hypothetical protein